MQIIFILAILLPNLVVSAAERSLGFAEFPLDQTPAGFTNLLVGRGRPADWRTVLDDVPPVLAPLNAKARSESKTVVLAQRARDVATPHIPLLIFENEDFGDFKFTTRFKIVGGALEQTVGLVFRFQNESNFFVILADAQRGNVRCTKLADGIFLPPLPANPPTVSIARDEWHELSVQCDGTRITGWLDGKDLIKLVDNASAGIVGRIGFCTRSDTVAYFADARVTYESREILAQKLVRNTLAQFSRLVDLKIYAVPTNKTAATVVAGKNEKDLGRAGDKPEMDVIHTGHSYFGKDKEQGTVTVILPLRDRNGEPMAAVSLEMKSFAGQTQENALVRAQPIIKQLQAQVQSLGELLQ